MVRSLMNFLVDRGREVLGPINVQAPFDLELHFLVDDSFGDLHLLLCARGLPFELAGDGSVMNARFVHDDIRATQDIVRNAPSLVES